MCIYMSKQIHRPLCKRMWVGLIFEHFLKRGHESFGEACKLYLSIPEQCQMGLMELIYYPLKLVVYTIDIELNR